MPNGYRMTKDEYQSFCKRYGQQYYAIKKRYASMIRAKMVIPGKSTWCRDAIMELNKNFKNRFGLNVTEFGQIKVGSRPYRRPRVMLPEVVGVIHTCTTQQGE